MKTNANIEMIWRSFRGRLRAFVRSRVPDENAASDVLQQAFLKMHRALGEGKPLDDPRAWVFAVTRNAITDHYRSDTSQTSRVVAAAEEPGTRSEHSVEADTDMFSQLSKCVEPLLQGMEQPYRDALQWTVFEGMTQKAAAERAHVSLSGMKSRVQRGRTMLRDLFDKCCAIEVDARGKPIEAVQTGRCPIEFGE